jgi:hypothetical protein
MGGTSPGIDGLDPEIQGAKLRDVLGVDVEMM